MPDLVFLVKYDWPFKNGILDLFVNLFIIIIIFVFS